MMQSPSHALTFVIGDHDAATSFVDRALALNPNLAGAWYASGWIRVWLGESDLAIAHMANGMRLSPRDPHMIGMQGELLSPILSRAGMKKRRLGQRKLCGSSQTIEPHYMLLRQVTRLLAGLRMHGSR